MTLVQIDGVTKRYGHTTVLDGLSFEVAEHEIACLIGGSGSGKSTILRCINGLERINGGRIRFDGETVSGEGVDLDAMRRKIGIVFQGYNLFPHMSVLDNVMLAPRHAMGMSTPAAKELAMEYLGRVGLADKAARFPDALSGGQQQRVAIVRAMALGPKVLLLDEVTSALDPELVGEVLDLIRELASTGMTMIMATHEMALVKELATKVYFLDRGKICEKGAPGDLLTAPKEARTQAFLRRIIEAGRLP